MEDTKQTKSAKAERPGGSNFKSPCCDSEKMAQMMRMFCGGKDETFECCAMIQKMCGTDPKQSKKG